MKKALIALMLLSWSAAVFAAPLDIKTSVDKNRITIGERIMYDVTIEYDDGIHMEPLRLAENLGEFEIKDYKITEPKKNKSGRWSSETKYLITTFTTGEFIIPAIKINYKDPNGDTKEDVSEEIKISVDSVKPKPSDTDDIRPLKGPAEIKGKISIWVFVALAFLLLIATGLFIYVKARKQIKGHADIPIKPAEEIAREALQVLLKKGYLEKGMIKEFYIELSDIIRVYIEGRFGIVALDKTTWEIYHEMRSRKIERAHIDRIRYFLDDCDMVKFAKYIPAKKEIEGAYKDAEGIIRMTTERSLA